MTELDEVAEAIWQKFHAEGFDHAAWLNKNDAIRHVAAQMPGESMAIVHEVANIAYEKMRKIYPYSCAACLHPITGKGVGRGWTCGNTDCMKDYYN